MHRLLATMSLVLLGLAASPKKLAAEATRERVTTRSSRAQGQQSLSERFCFIGALEGMVYYAFDREKPPPPPEEFDPRPFVLVDVLEVVSGHPPVDGAGKYQHTGLDLLVVGGRYPLPGLTYQFSGYWRKDPTSGRVLFQEEECRPLWGRWLAWLAAYVAVATALVALSGWFGLRLAGMLRRSRA